MPKQTKEYSAGLRESAEIDAVSVISLPPVNAKVSKTVKNV